jgi:branched-chain amino acid transport system permease protein
MTINWRNIALFSLVFGLIIVVGFTESWNLSLGIINMGLVSAIMALGVNIQWGYAGLFNVGIMGFVALGGLAAVLVGMPPTEGAWSAGGLNIIGGLLFGGASVAGAVVLWKKMAKGLRRNLAMITWLIVSFMIFRALFDAGVSAVEAINPAATGYLGGINGFGDNYRDQGWIMFLAWPVGGVFAGAAAWLIGKTTLGLRSDYLAIATLGISEIIIAILKNEDWLARGVKNVAAIPRPVPYAVDLQKSEGFEALATSSGLDVVTASTLAVKLSFTGFFVVVLLALILLTELALKSPWGRMMRAIRDNEVSAAAMGKNVTKRHLQVFVIGAAVCGIAGAMMVTLDGIFTPGTYNPLRFTFLIWVMVIVGGSGNNWGAVLGGFLIYTMWIMVETWGPDLMFLLTSGLADDSALKVHLINSVAHMRLLSMGLILLLVLRFSPRGLIPEK